MRLRYTLRAAAELSEALAYVEERSPIGARHVQARIQTIMDFLLQRWPAYEQWTLAANGRLSLSVSDFLRSD